ncbi:hypothetical protein BGX28_005690 [Mortierella sp. GBA30]|nr:hypothetical protein BGX28_005690 [Mortierella sp. GBA30]
MLSLPPFKPMWTTAEAITAILAETKDSIDVSSTPAASQDNGSDISIKNRPSLFDTPIKTTLMPTLSQYTSLEPVLLLESAFKLKLITIQDEFGTRIAELKDALFRCLDLALRCSELGHIDHASPLNYIEELLDYQTVESSEHIYDYLESRVDRLTVNMIAGRGKGLTMLRLCNELLRRLSKAKNTVFCGRILILLSSVFPLTERSGVNLRGDFNTENITLIESEDVTIVPELVSTPQDAQKDDASQVPVDEKMEVDGEQAEDDKKVDVSKKDSAFYTEFWGLQAFFCNPATLNNSRENMDKLQQGMEHTLTRFSVIKEAEQKARGQRLKELSSDPRTAESNESETHSTMNGTAKGSKRKHSDSDAEPTTYFPKFLTSPKLLQLEMVDPYFRKHILIQFLIILQYLQDHNESAKEAYAKIVNPNKSFQPQWIMEDKDQEWANTTKTKILDELKEVGLESGDKRYLNSINSVLDDEESWVQWKAENCKAFEKEPLKVDDVEATRQKRRKLKIQLASMNQKLGCYTLSKVWEEVAQNTDEDTGLGSSSPPPTTEGYMHTVAIEVKRDEMRRRGQPERTEEEKKAAKELEESRFWRSLRLGSRQYLHLYGKHSSDIKYDFDSLKQDLKDDDRLEDLIMENGGKLPPPPKAPETDPSAPTTTTVVSQPDTDASNTEEQTGTSLSQYDESSTVDKNEESAEKISDGDVDMKETETDLSEKIETNVTETNEAVEGHVDADQESAQEVATTEETTVASLS